MSNEIIAHMDWSRWKVSTTRSKVDEAGNVEERHCKLDVSVFRGWVFSWFLLVGTLVTIPYGVVADSMGREVVVAARDNEQ
ncbi:hypothetical protein MKX08_002976 [Trichoderma sp. CBMAI-0020]|nr:hypothetical protein MKX08_002976 [Trichoderma sp. CBMAI-0020]